MKRQPAPRLDLRWLGSALLLALLWSCAPIAPDGQVIARNKDFLVLTAGPNDTLRSLAGKYLGDQSKGWVIAELNNVRKVKAGQEVVIPMRPLSGTGVYSNGYQTVPILTYHRFTPGGQRCDKLAVTENAFVDQLGYLKANGYSVIDFRDLADFLAGRSTLPRKSVILSIDDGYRAAYDIAFPALKRAGMKVTVFVYSDFIGAGAGLTWAQMREMVDSGLVDIQPHSKSHGDLTERQPGESLAAYRKRLLYEVTHPAKLIEKHLGLPIHTFSYPYGAENDEVVAAVEKAGYSLGTTVTRGGNASFAHPKVLRRTQIYCGDDIGTFARRLETFEAIALK